MSALQPQPHPRSRYPPRITIDLPISPTSSTFNLTPLSAAFSHHSLPPSPYHPSPYTSLPTSPLSPLTPGTVQQISFYVPHLPVATSPTTPTPTSAHSYTGRSARRPLPLPPSPVSASPKDYLPPRTSVSVPEGKGRGVWREISFYVPRVEDVDIGDGVEVPAAVESEVNEEGGRDMQGASEAGDGESGCGKKVQSSAGETFDPKIAADLIAGIEIDHGPIGPLLSSADDDDQESGAEQHRSEDDVDSKWSGKAPVLKTEASDDIAPRPVDIGETVSEIEDGGFDAEPDKVVSGNLDQEGDVGEDEDRDENVKEDEDEGVTEGFEAEEDEGLEEDEIEGLEENKACLHIVKEPETGPSEPTLATEIVSTESDGNGSATEVATAGFHSGEGAEDEDESEDEDDADEEEEDQFQEEDEDNSATPTDHDPSSPAERALDVEAHRALPIFPMFAAEAHDATSARTSQEASIAVSSSDAKGGENATADHVEIEVENKVLGDPGAGEDEDELADEQSDGTQLTADDGDGHEIGGNVEDQGREGDLEDVVAESGAVEEILDDQRDAGELREVSGETMFGNEGDEAADEGEDDLEKAVDDKGDGDDLEVPIDDVGVENYHEEAGDAEGDHQQSLQLDQTNGGDANEDEDDAEDRAQTPTDHDIIIGLAIGGEPQDVSESLPPGLTGEAISRELAEEPPAPQQEEAFEDRAPTPTDHDIISIASVGGPQNVAERIPPELSNEEDRQRDLEVTPPFSPQEQAEGVEDRARTPTDHDIIGVAAIRGLQDVAEGVPPELTSAKTPRQLLEEFLEDRTSTPTDHDVIGVPSIGNPQDVAETVPAGFSRDVAPHPVLSHPSEAATRDVATPTDREDFEDRAPTPTEQDSIGSSHSIVADTDNKPADLTNGDPFEVQPHVLLGPSEVAVRNVTTPTEGEDLEDRAPTPTEHDISGFPNTERQIVVDITPVDFATEENPPPIPKDRSPTFPLRARIPYVRNVTPPTSHLTQSEIASILDLDAEESELLRLENAQLEAELARYRVILMKLAIAQKAEDTQCIKTSC
ncbi:uncharacterized protein EV422DRAFT_565436 [Fimicolochytrium jonesii]|uniref:uncharacterized protein n=1 Tax=Fimicolochytrium jonesii TaxID=1396493 RepID=UPI0022FED3E9|nr:uncharacterized protein EV422DRAFT_565436 [Fimicolochytrium jonesii]KAI8823495.1 hypothetical protein EV422DRAFT_565436 [Fimicolochytrium jonesii]